MTPTQDKKHIKVLYLDDEENNLRSFKAAFRRDYQVYTAISTEEAFNIIKSVKPQVIFSDQRMPVTSGVEFFNAVRQVFPDPVRILITGFTDVNDIIDAINKGHVYRFITKPWSEAEIRVAIENAYDLYKTRCELQSKVVDLEKINHELSRFIYSASHDLRAPLATVLGLVRVARLEVKEEVAMDYFDKVETSVQKLDILVNHIIDYYKNSRAEDHLREIHLEDMLDDILESMKSDRGSDDAKVEIKVTQEVPFIADEFRLRIILSHLISNAIKFKKADQKKARVEIDFSSNAKEAHIAVRDQGMGILKEHLEKVFQMFFKTKVKKSGSGLGLYIVKEALTKMNGEIEVNSKTGEGSEFFITIPNLHGAEADQKSAAD